jgi:serine/threonine-protein kinase RsbT
MVMEWAVRLDFSVVVRTKFVTAASELGRNALVHGRGGSMIINELLHEGRTALQLVFEDQGPGIANVDQAMADGYSTANSLGLGLGGSRRLVNEFFLETQAGQGTKVTITQWKKR